MLTDTKHSIKQVQALTARQCAQLGESNSQNNGAGGALTTAARTCVRAFYAALFC